MNILVNALPISQCNLLASASSDKTIRLWDLNTPAVVSRVLIEQSREFWSVAFNRDGHLLAAASADQTVKLWNLNTPEAAPTSLRGYEREVRAVAFSPDGRTLASAGSDKTIRLWDMNMPAVAPRVLRGHKNTVWSVAFSPNGKTFASASSDQTIMLWMAETSRLSDLVCQRVLRNMTFDEWQNLVGEGLPYERTCENLPVHASVLEAAENRASSDDAEGAIALFERVDTLDPTLPLAPEKQAKTIAADALVDRGRAAARNGNADEATVLLKRAKKLNSMLAFSLEQEVAEGLVARSWDEAQQGNINQAMNAFQQAKTLFPHLSRDESQIKWRVAWALRDQGRNAAQAGKITDALADYDKAREIGSTLEITAENWDILCWYGSLWGHAAEVMSACEQAVSLEPENGAWHHSRGVARGIVDDFEGAIEDLRFFVLWAKQHQGQGHMALRQEAWIEALERGHNPFDAEMLETLRNKN